MFSPLRLFPARLPSKTAQLAKPDHFYFHPCAAPSQRRRLLAPTKISFPPKTSRPLPLPNSASMPPPLRQAHSASRATVCERSSHHTRERPSLHPSAHPPPPPAPDHGATATLQIPAPVSMTPKARPTARPLDAATRPPLRPAMMAKRRRLPRRRKSPEPRATRAERASRAKMAPATRLRTRLGRAARELGRVRRRCRKRRQRLCPKSRYSNGDLVFSQARVLYRLADSVYG